MIIPAIGKVLVEVFKLTHSTLVLPETVKKPELSVAQVINGNSLCANGCKVLIPTRAGLDIKDGENHYRLLNESDVVAILKEDINDIR